MSISAQLNLLNVINGKPINDHQYQVGCILNSSWGYEQTNIDFYKIVKRSNNFITLQQIGQNKNYTSDMSGTTLPDINTTIGQPFRRKLMIHNNQILGCKLEKSYGSISAWEGKPEQFSTYA